MEIKLCKTGDGKPAIGTGIRPIEYCRGCYVDTYGPEFVEANVIIDHKALKIDPEALAIACARTGEDISAGTVWLDPVETNAVALVYSGFIELVPPKPAPKAAARTTEA